MRRPDRWDHPFDPDMTEAKLAVLLARDPWAGMYAEKPEKILQILSHDARVVSRRRGEIVVREGDYGNSAFFIMRGSVRVVVESPGLSRAEEGKLEAPRKGLLGALAQLWRNRREPEARESPSDRLERMRKQGAAEDYVPIILKDVDAVLDRHRTAQLKEGEVFGEIAALGRTPRTATVFADDDKTELLEIRWQGLRDLRRQFPVLKEHVDARFRARVLSQHLRAAPAFARVGDTPDVRAHLAAGRIDELFLDALGHARPQARPLAVEVAGEKIRVDPVSVSPARAERDQVAVWRCAAGDSRALQAPEGRAELVRRLGSRHEGPLVLVLAGVPRGARTWLWRGRDAGDGAQPVEIAESGRKGPDEVIQRLIRVVVLEEIGRQAEFHSYGAFDASTKSTSLSDEPVIAAQGQYPNGIILLRAGVARVSASISGEERTVSYLGPGHAYGLEEIAQASRHPDHPASLRRTLRAVGYVDTVMIPTPVVERYVLPSIPESELPAPPAEAGGAESPLAAMRAVTGVDRSLVEFLVDRRFANGTAAMVIDLFRCTRCDDCVRACASAHDGNPRFLRHGPTQGRFMVANACMHCVDPVCMIGCPTGAISRESAEGQVVINDATCIGCASCANNCPYFNIRMVETRSERGVFYVDADNQAHRKATKCDLCLDQLGGPACQRACPHEALQRVNLNDLDVLAEWTRR